VLVINAGLSWLLTEACYLILWLSLGQGYQIKQTHNTALLLVIGG
jgi:hypothetical protein